MIAGASDCVSPGAFSPRLFDHVGIGPSDHDGFRTALNSLTDVTGRATPATAHEIPRRRRTVRLLALAVTVLLLPGVSLSQPVVEVTNGGYTLTLESFSLEPGYRDRNASSGWEYAAARMSVTRTAPDPSPVDVNARAVSMVEDAAFPYWPEPPQGDDPFWTAGPLAAGATVSGELVFLIPAAHGELSLRFDLGDAVLSLPTTSAAAPPAPSAGPLHVVPEAPVSREQIAVAFEGLPGKQGDWLAIAVRDTPDSSYLPYSWTYLDGPAGTARFNGLGPGDYEARAYSKGEDGTERVVARVAFAVALSPTGKPGEMVRVPRRTIRQGDPVTVAWTGLPGNDHDWISIATAGSADDERVTYDNTRGQPAGRLVFGPVEAGRYEARVFFAGGGEVQDRIAFEVVPRDSVPDPHFELACHDAPGLTDAARRELGAATQLASLGELALDGDWDNYDADKGAASLNPERPTYIWLSRPWPLDRIGFLLWDGDRRTYRYRVLASPDGATWSEISDTTSEPVQGGWRQIDLAGRDYMAFAFVDLATSATAGGVRLVEFEACSPDAPPALSLLQLPAAGADPPPWVDRPSPQPVNIALALLGAAVAADASGPNLDSPSEMRADASAGNPITVTFDRAYQIARLRIVLASYDSGYRYRVEGTADGQSWELLADRTGAARAGVDEIDVEGRTLAAVRLTGTGSTDGSGLSIFDLQAFAIGPGPITAVGEPIQLPLDEAPDNVALQLNGGRIESISSEARFANGSAADAAHLIDGSSATEWIARDAQLPQEFVVSFANGQRAAIDAVDFHAGSNGEVPKIVELAVAGGDANEPWRRIGRFALLRRQVQRIGFAPVAAAALRVTILSAHSSYPVGLGEIVVRETRSGAAASVLAHRRGDFDGGPNLAHVAVGGRIALGRTGDYGPDALIDGHAWPWEWGYDEGTVDLATPAPVIALAGGRAALIGGVAMSPTAGESPGRWPAAFEVWASESGPEEGFHRVGRFMLGPGLAPQVFAFAPVKARFVRLLLIGTQGDSDYATLGEFEVLEASAPGYRSVLADDRPNLLDLRLGGHVAVPAGRRRVNLIDATTETPGWIADRPGLPVSITFGFRGGEPRRFDAVGINPKANSDPASWARRAKVFVSDNPIRDFRALGTFDIAPEDRMQFLEFPAVTARYVRVRLLATGDRQQPVAAGEVRVREAISAGPQSIVYRAAAPPAEPEEPAPATVPDADAGEPNDTLAQATVLPLGMPAVGRIPRPDDFDWYVVDTSTAVHDVLNLSLSQAPTIRLTLDLFDASGTPVTTQNLADLGRNTVDLTFKLPQGRYFLRLSRPPNSLAFLVDRSNSVAGVSAEIVAVAEKFAAAVQPGDAIAYMALGPNLIAPFSSDPQALVAASRAIATAGSTSAVYATLLAALDLLHDRAGSKSIVIVTDGEDGSGPGTDLLLWQRLTRGDVRIYGIGFGQAIYTQVEDWGTTGGDILRSLSRATNGRYFDAPTGEAITQLYPTIAADLRGDAPYTIRAATPVAEGSLQVVPPAEPVAGVSAPGQIALIFDASGSMKAEVSPGITRMDAARGAIHAIIDDLPEGTIVGLRVYGHRQPNEPKEASCQDTEMLVPFEDLDRERLHAAIDGVEPRGQTPIGLSLAQLESDFAGAAGRKEIMIVTDGIETCDPAPVDPNYPAKVVERLISAGISVRTNVVGFEIGDSASREFLSSIAIAGQGHYFETGAGDEIRSAFAEAFRPSFAIVDSAGVEVARGKMGDDPLILAEGYWGVTLETDPISELGVFPVSAGQPSRILIEKEGESLAASLASSD